ncbi:Arm DNA-binding domain-containing protein [Wenyingzhuangia sp. 1_MG-2023]|nr:Arm DNA-binding domain-containing protein [Wenyingzhuangia sp. 1_MG-2023]
MHTQNVEPGHADLYVRITIKSKRANFSLKKKILVSKWDSSKSRMKGNSQEARIFNQSLDKGCGKMIVYTFLKISQPIIELLKDL